MKTIKVVVHGALGKMGREIVGALSHEPGIEVIGAVDKLATQEYLSLPDGSATVPFSADLGSLLEICHPDVVIDFSIAEASISAARIAIKQGVDLVIGTTGLSNDNLIEIDQLAKASNVGAIIAPNFALGMIVLFHLAKTAARFFDYAEIVELHHHEKADAPSGTALTTAKAMAEAHGRPFYHPLASKESLASSRGGQLNGISIHSVRLPGLMASQEVIFGGPGQTLSMRHDATSRKCYLPGIILATKEVVKHKGLVYGLDALLNLDGD